MHPKVRENALHAPTVLNGTHVVAFSTAPDVRTRKGTPRVTAEVVAVFPTGDFLDEWWAGDHAQGDVDVCLEIGGWRRWKLIRSPHGLP